MQLDGAALSSGCVTAFPLVHACMDCISVVLLAANTTRNRNTKMIATKQVAAHAFQQVQSWWNTSFWFLKFKIWIRQTVLNCRKLLFWIHLCGIFAPSISTSHVSNQPCFWHCMSPSSWLAPGTARGGTNTWIVPQETVSKCRLTQFLCLPHPWFQKSGQSRTEAMLC